MRKALPRSSKRNFSESNNVKMARSKARQRRSARFSSSKNEKPDEKIEQNEERMCHGKTSNLTDFPEPKHSTEKSDNLMFLSPKQYDAIFGESGESTSNANETSTSNTSKQADCPPKEKV
eukprot:TCONS_00032211-protein